MAEISFEEAMEFAGMDDKGLRYNEGKPQLSYLLDFPLAAKGLAARFEIGAKKYSRDNWRKGLDEKQLIDSLMRHLLAFANGEQIDEDGGFHIDAVVWNSIVLSEQFHKREKHYDAT